MFGSKRLAAALAALLVLSSVVPATAVAADSSAEGSAAAEAQATVHVEVTSNATVLTVEENGSAAADAAVTGFVVVALFLLTAVVQAYSRRREYAADETAARATGRPLALATALEKIDRAVTPGGLLSTLVVNGDEEGPVTDLLASHPPMVDRIDRLRRLAASGDGRER